MSLCVDPNPSSTEPYEITSTGIFLRGDWLLRGNLLLGKSGSTLSLNAADDELGERIGERVQMLGHDDVGLGSQAQASDDFKRSTVVPQHASIEGAASKAVPVEGDIVIDKNAVNKFHDSQPPVVVRTNTVADRGGAASLSTEGGEA